MNNRNLTHILVGLLVVVSCGTAKAADEYKVVSAFNIAAEPACMPAVTRAPNGDILVAFSTEWEPIPQGGAAKLVVSKDQGKTWSKPRVIWKDKDPRVTIQVACGMQTLSNGDILLPLGYNIIPKRKDVDPSETNPLKMYDCDPNHPDYQREVRFLRSSDNGQTWAREAPRFTPAAQHVVPFGRLLETRDGRLIKPVYWASPAGSWYYESRDFGKTWGPPVFVTKPFGCEWNIVEATNGTFFAIIRAAAEPPRRTFGTSFSHDAGKTWSPPQSAGVQGKMPDLLVLPSGRILMAVGAEGLSDGSLISIQKDRYSFCTLFISDDHGQTWRRDVEFEQLVPGSSVVPADGPGLVQLSDGRILTVIQAVDRSGAFGFNVGMTVIGNIIEPVSGK